MTRRTVRWVLYPVEDERRDGAGDAAEQELEDGKPCLWSQELVLSSDMLRGIVRRASSDRRLAASSHLLFDIQLRKNSNLVLSSGVTTEMR